MKKPCRKCKPKASPRHIIYFSKQPNSHCTEQILLKDILKGDHQKP